MSEEIVTFGNKQSLVGVLHRPDGNAAKVGLPVILMLNAGILHRVGPNRLYVNIARRLELKGFNVLRFDVRGIGDSQDQNGGGDSRTFIDDTKDAFDLLTERVGVSKFTLMGICMGARIALDVASIDSRVESLVLMEGIYIKSARYHISRILEPEKWKRVFTGQSNMIKKVRDTIVSSLGISNGKNQTVIASKNKAIPFLDEDRSISMKQKLFALLKRGTQILLVFRDGNEIAYNYRLREEGDDIFALGLPKGLDVAFIRFADHTFTPLVSQDLLLKVTMNWIENTHLRREPL